jgi:hypothetical protein
VAEPRTSLHMWKRSIILLVVLVNILVRVYTVAGGRRRGKCSLLLFDHRIQDKKAAEKSQPKSIEIL